jgi:hypothetical protein
MRIFSRPIVLCAVALGAASCAHVPREERPAREAALAAGAGGSHAPGSTGLGAGTQGPATLPPRVIAQGPGSRIRTTPEVPLPPQPNATESTKRCETLRGEERERCLREAAAAAPATTKPSGPASTGMGSGAGTGASSGTSGAGASGGASLGGSAPR